MPESLRTPEDRFAALPGFGFDPNYISLEGDLDGLRMHYLDEGSGAPILMLHGEPTWSYLYRKMVTPLSRTHRVVAPDLIGFGRSDKVVDPKWYSYDRHVASVRQLIQVLDLSDITVVVQDWGGPIGLRVAVEERTRFSRLVILNTGVFRPGPRWPNPAFLQWLDFVKRNPDLPVGSIIQGATATEVPDDVIAAYEAPFPDARYKGGVSSFPLLVPLTAEDPGAAAMLATREALDEWDAPVLVAFSDGDPIFPQRAGEKLAEKIPGARFHGITGASHFLQEDKGEVIAEAIEAFLDH